MALPNIAGQQDAGVNPLDVQKQANQNQKIAEILGSIETRLGNILNVRTGVQSAVYEAFGNNVLTRTMTQVSDSLVDSFKALFEDPEAERQKDPTMVALKEQSAKLTDLIEILNNTSSISSEMSNDLISLRQDFKQLILNEKNGFVVEESLLNSILEKLESAKISTDDVDRPDVAALTNSIVELKHVIVSLDKHFKDFTKKQTSRTKSRRRPVDIDVESVVVDDETPSVEPKPTGNVIKLLEFDRLTNSSSDVSDDELSKPSKSSSLNSSKQEKLLRRILTVLVETAKNIKKLVDAQPLSSREDELEKNTSKSIKDVVDKKMSPDTSASNPFDFTRIFRGLFDLPANILGLKNIFKKLGSVLTPLLTLFSKLGSGISAVLGKIAPVVGRGLLAAAPVAAAATVAVGAGMAVDYGLGKLGVGGNDIDVAQDEVNWEKSSFGEKAQSAIARGIEEVGDVVGLDNMVNQAKAERIKNETEYFKNKEAVQALSHVDDNNWNRLSGVDKVGSSIARGIEHVGDFIGFKGLSDKARLDRISSESALLKSDINKSYPDITSNVNRIDEVQKQVAQPVAKTTDSGKGNVSVTNNNISNNQTIMPTRTVVKNQDPSYNRYLDSVLKR